ncbi:MAG TPA: polysaccharide biosynthesis tyrosine autokinase [Bryobacteraceae bacterium]|nr:polysaccharide biosynthesis tyrosine autokinase [Bryobacteraceae bacterium]
MSILIPGGTEHEPHTPERGPTRSTALTASRASLPAAAPTFDLSYFDGFGGEEPDALADYWSIIKARLGLLIAITLLGGIAAFFLTKLVRPIYQAHTSLEIQSINGNFLNVQDVSPTAPSSGVYSEEYDIQTAVRSLQSRSVLGYTLRQGTIRERLVAEAGRARTPFARWFGIGGQRGLDDDQLITDLFKSMKVQVQTNTRVIDLTVDSGDPQLAADLANTIVASYTELSLQKRWDSVQATGAWLTNQMHDLKTRLESSEAEMQRYADSSNLLFTSDSGNVAEQRLKEIQDQVLQAEADRITKQSRYELASTAPVESLPDVLDDPALKDYKVTLAQLQQQLAELSTSFTPAYPKIVKLKSQIAALEQARDKERHDIVSRIGNDYGSARRRENLLRADFLRQAHDLSDQATKVARYNLLKREVESTRQLYDSIGQRVREAGLASAMRASNVQVMDRATRPQKPHRPSSLINTAVGLFSGLLLGLIGIIGVAKSSRGAQQPGDALVYLNVPELAVVPAVTGSLPGAVLSFLPAARKNSLDMIAFENQSSPVADSFRAALVSITRNHKGAAPKVIVVSSALPGEGKTSVVSNLGISLAQTKRRVLLIDGDLRRPRLHEIFKIDNASGLSEMLIGTGSFCAHSTQVPNLFLLPSGAHCDVHALFDQSLLALLERARAEYDVVLVDSPPLLQIPDARILAQHADGVILAVDAQSTRREETTLAAGLLAQDGIPVIGTILNNYRQPKWSRYYNEYAKEYYAKTAQ